MAEPPTSKEEPTLAMVTEDDDRGMIQVYQKEASGVSQSSGSHGPILNMPVRVEPQEVRLREDGGLTYEQAVRNLQSLALAQKRLSVEELKNRLQGFANELQKSLPRRPQMSTLNVPELKDIEREHPAFIRAVYLFVLTGSINGKYSPKHDIRAAYDELSCLDDILKDNINSFKILNFLVDIQTPKIKRKPLPSFFNQIMVFTKILFYGSIQFQQCIVEFNKIIDIPHKLYIFIMISQNLTGRQQLIETKRLTSDEVRFKRLERLNPSSQLSLVPTMDGSSSQNQTSPQIFKLSSTVLNCVKMFIEDDKKSPDLLLYFKLEPLQTKILQYYNILQQSIDFSDLIHLSPPEFSQQQQSSELKSLIVSYRHYDEKDFREKADMYLKNHPFLNALENNVMKIILMNIELEMLRPEKEGDIDILINYWKEYGKRNDFTTRSSIKYCETVHEILNEECYGYRLTIQQLPEYFLRVPQIWQEMIEDIPILELFDRLPFLFNELHIISNEIILIKIIECITNIDRLLMSKMHPVILIKHYWRLTYLVRDLHPHQRHPNQEKIIQALYNIFHICLKSHKFKEEFSTYKRYCFALDVTLGMFQWSGLMDTQIPLIDAALSMLLCYYNFEEFFDVYVFSNELQDIGHLFGRNLKLNELKEEISKISGKRVDCFLPVAHALEFKLDFDIFIIFASTAQFAERHDRNILETYRATMRRPFAKMIVNAMLVHDFNFAHPNDSYMFDICGFDENVPNYISRIAKLADVTDK